MRLKHLPQRILSYLLGNRIFQKILTQVLISNKMIYGNVKIGKNVGIGHNTVIHAYESIIIKDDAKIAPYCFIVDSNHQIDGVKNCVGVPQTKPITIGKGVWIGTHSVILMGVEIGDGSVIGAGSVLTKNVPEKEIWAGNPARFIKKIQ